MFYVIKIFSSFIFALEGELGRIYLNCRNTFYYPPVVFRHKEADINTFPCVHINVRTLRITTDDTCRKDSVVSCSELHPALVWRAQSLWLVARACPAPSSSAWWHTFLVQEEGWEVRCAHEIWATRGHLLTFALFFLWVNCSLADFFIFTGHLGSHLHPVWPPCLLTQ